MTISDCIIGPGTKGYHPVRRKGKVKGAHIWAYIDAYGPVPPGMEVHHTCNNSRCINPEHLAAVTHKENIRLKAGWFRKDGHWYCKKGHLMEGRNLYEYGGKFRCQACNKLRQQEYRL